jgi:sec-independent protein translocase protein TatC
MAQKNMKEMSFLEHLEILRWILIRSTIAMLVMAILVFTFSDFIFDDILFAPTKTNFITYTSFCDLSHYLNFADSICVTELPFIIQNTDMEGQVNVLVWICITAGFILSFPYILFEFWKFISPALYEKERKNALSFILVSSILFFTGVLFGYYIVVPMSVNFFATFTVSHTVLNQFTLSSYISMVKTSVVASGLFFELPIIIYFLTKIGLVNPVMLRKYRKIAIIIVLIVAAIVTPPDVVSQVIVAIPMLIIFEASVIISAIVYKKQNLENL